MASPKHPQSITGLKISRTSVSNVKKVVSATTAIPTTFLHTPLISAAPSTASVRAKATPKKMARAHKPRALSTSALIFAKISSGGSIAPSASEQSILMK